MNNDYLAKLGEGSTFKLPVLPSIRWVVIKHERSKVEIMGDAYGQLLFATAEMGVAAKLKVDVVKVVEPSDHKRLGEALVVMKNSKDYVVLEALDVGDLADHYFSSLQTIYTIKVELHNGPTTWVSVYDDDGNRLGLECLLSSTEVLKHK